MASPPLPAPAPAPAPTPTPTPTPAPGSKPGTKKAPGAIVGVAAIALAIIGSLNHWEGNKFVPYYDQAGVLTVCKGITGPSVIKDKKYTQEECTVLETKYVTKMLNTMGRCVSPDVIDRIKSGMWIAFGHWSYNVGTASFCNSGVNRALAAGNFVEACRQMGKWTFITKPGKGKVNCRNPAEKCGGLPKRRDFEVKMCMDAIAS